MHAHSALAIEGAQLVAVAAETPEEAAPLARDCAARVEATAEALCAAEDIDLVIVATPTYLHAAHTIAAARAHKHVFCEKPLARTLADAEAMVHACDAGGVRLAVGHVVRFFPEYRRGGGVGVEGGVRA